MPRKNVLFAATLFILFVLALTRIDYLIHADLYDYGLQFSVEWAQPYWLIYGLTYHLVAVTLAWAARSRWLFAAFEVFVWSNTQDIVFFMWGGFNFPLGVWWWMSVPNWTTPLQLSVSTLALTSLSLIYGLKSKIVK